MDPALSRLLSGMMANRLTEEDKADLAGKLQQLAAEFYSDPEKGLAAGFVPSRPPSFRRSLEIGSPPASFGGSKYVEWLKAVAVQYLPAGRWRVDVSLGEGPNSGHLAIF